MGILCAVDVPAQLPAEPPIVALFADPAGAQTSLAADLAVFLRTLDENLPVLILALGSSHACESRFSLRAASFGEEALARVWALGSPGRAIRLGQFGENAAHVFKLLRARSPAAPLGMPEITADEVEEYPLSRA